MKRAGIAAAALVYGYTLFVALPALSQTDFTDDFELSRAPLDGETRLSLRRAVEIAIESNPELVVERLQIEQAREGVEEQRGVYDPVFDLSGLVGRRDNVVASRFFPTGLYVEEDTIYGAGVAGVTHFGSRYALDLSYQRQFSTSNTQSLSPQYAANLDLTFNQPLFRDFGTEVVLTGLRVAQREQEISEEDLAVTISAVVFRVVQAYWNLVFLQEDLEVRRTGLALAEALLAQNEALFDAGQVPEVSVHEARAGVFERQEEVIRFENEVRGAEDLLKTLLYADLATVTVIPDDVLEDVPVEVDPQRSYQLAIDRRPEMIRLQKEIERSELESAFASNQVRPRIDLNVTLGLSGLSGRPNQTLVNPGSPQLGRAGDTVAGSVFAGLTRPLAAFDRFFTGEGFDHWSVELRLELPIRNRTAEARLANANLRLRETQVSRASVREQVILQVRDALRGIETARQSIEASRAGVRAVEEQLVATRVRFEAGLTTSYEVLRVLDSLAQARRRELRALVDHHVAWAALKVAEGTILEEYNVEIQAASESGAGRGLSGG